VRIVALAGAAVAAATLSVTSAGGAGASPAKEGGTLRVAIIGDLFDSVDAAITGFPATIPVVRATCAGLYRQPDKSTPAAAALVPELATGYPRISDGGKTYTITIRRGLRFSTGSPVTARDVVHTIDRLLDPGMKSYSGSFFRDVVGAKAVLAGKAKTATGIVAHGNSLTIHLTRPLGDFTVRLGIGVCVVPQNVPADPEGAKPPIPSAAPYYVAEYVPGQAVVLARNTFYRGPRPHHVDRVEIDLTQDAPTIIDRVERSELDYGWVPATDYADRVTELTRKYGVNKSRLFAVPVPFLRMFALNTARPLFRDNTKLRQAVNFAVDRRALLRERGVLAGTPTDQYLPPGMPGFRDERIYPLKAPDLRRARALARGSLRTGKAILYAPTNAVGVAQAQIVKTDLKKIGLDVHIELFPPQVLFEKLEHSGAYDIGWIGWLADLPDPGSLLNALFDGRSIGTPASGNFSYFDSSKYNRLLARADRLTGTPRARAFGNLDVQLARDAAPAVAYAFDYALTLVSDRVGCVVVNPYLDLAAACLR
jgi:ABC-type transport system substrate-binding protein